MNGKMIALRAGKTFLQAALGYLCTLSFMDMDCTKGTVLAGIALSAIAAGISALMNTDWEGMLNGG